MAQSKGTTPTVLSSGTLMNILTIMQRFPYLNRSLFQTTLTAKSDSAPLSRSCLARLRSPRAANKKCSMCAGFGALASMTSGKRLQKPSSSNRRICHNLPALEKPAHNGSIFVFNRESSRPLGTRFRHGSRVVPQKNTLGIKSWHEYRGIPRNRS